MVAPDLGDPARFTTGILVSLAECLRILTNLLGFPFLLSSLDMIEVYPISPRNNSNRYNDLLLLNLHANVAFVYSDCSPK